MDRVDRHLGRCSFLTLTVRQAMAHVLQKEACALYNDVLLQKKKSAQMLRSRFNLMASLHETQRVRGYVNSTLWIQ